MRGPPANAPTPNHLFMDDSECLVGTTWLPMDSTVPMLPPSDDSSLATNWLSGVTQKNRDFSANPCQREDGKVLNCGDLGGGEGDWGCLK